MIKDRNDMVDLMVELLENELSEPDYIPTARGREIINEIADYAEGTKLFAASGSRGTYIQGNCGIHGCAIIRAAGTTIRELIAEKGRLKRRIRFLQAMSVPGTLPERRDDP
jgi:hypothetical protein|nr:MAG TPA: hypothetical protein [Caudoviricetes sp.]